MVIAQQFIAGTTSIISMESVKRTAEASVAPLRGLQLLRGLFPSAEALGYFRSRGLTKTPSLTVGLLPRLRLIQQLLQIPLPDCRNRMCAVTASLVCNRQHHKPP